jgi:hypothetical protein
MALAVKRQQIADAVSNVLDVKGYPVRPKAIKPGDAWPIYGGLSLLNNWLAETWRVVIALGANDEVVASDWVDDHQDELVGALQHGDPSIGYVTDLVPIKLPTEAGDMYALQITLRSE